jgi:hypothetical protein
VVNSTLKDGSEWYNVGASFSNPAQGKMCILESADAVKGIVEFKTDSNLLNLYLPSGGCTDPMKSVVSTVNDMGIGDANWREEL